MASELERLVTAARDLARVAEGRPEGARARDLAERLEGGRFRVAVAGAFNRGKSTLLNALVGEEVLPTGVLPVTAVVTELAWGAPGATVVHRDGRREEVRREQVASFVTEAANPANAKGVARVEVRGRWPLLETGLVLVDVPGTGSVHEHNSEAARAALAEADGAVVVLAADQPLSGAERDLVRIVGARPRPAFFVLNRSDLLSPSELAEVAGFVGALLAEDLGAAPALYAVSARRALEDALAGRPPGPAAGEFAAFVAELERFVAEDLVSARLAAARDELGRLAAAVVDAVRLERAARDLAAADLADRVRRFRAAADAQRRAFDDACVLLERDVARITAAAGRRLAAVARDAPPRHRGALAEVAAGARRGDLHRALRAAVEEAVRASFERARREEADRVEAEWQAVATAFREEVRRQIQSVRDAAADLFEIPLPAARVPAVAEERERFFYLLVPAERFDEPIVRLAGRLLPGRLARRRALARAVAELARELDKHAGRARADLASRLDAARRRFVDAMAAELETAIGAVLAAAARAEEAAAAAGTDRAAWEESATDLVRVAEAVAAVAAGVPAAAGAGRDGPDAEPGGADG